MHRARLVTHRVRPWRRWRRSSSRAPRRCSPTPCCCRPPDGGADPPQAPTEISLRFDEQVEASLGAVRLYDSRGRRIDTGATTKPSGRSGRSPGPDEVAGGAYVVTWRVISADSHPVQGSFTFQVGTRRTRPRSSVQALAGNLLSKTGGSKAVGVVYGVARWLVFAALALLIGSVAFVVLIWPSGVRSRRRPDARLDRVDRARRRDAGIVPARRPLRRRDSGSVRYGNRA